MTDSAVTSKLASAQLYLCIDARRAQGDFADFLRAAFDGGVDIIQLRDKDLEAQEELALLETLRTVAEEFDALWAVNDRADIAALAGAPVFHGGQLDLTPEQSRTFLGQEPAIGLSTHSQQDVDAALAAGTLDYFCTGPLWSTPTKPGRTAVGLDLVRYAAGLDPAIPFFAIGGIDETNVTQVVDAGARRIVVVRAITDVEDPRAAARRLRAALPELAPK